MAATSLTLERPRNAPPPLPPGQLPDVSHMDGPYQQQLTALQQQWQHLSAAQTAAIVTAVGAVVAGGTLAALLDIPVDTTATAAALTAGMVAAGWAAARLVAAEAAAQGVTLHPVHVGPDTYGPVADVAARLLADEMRAAAVRAVLQTGPDATPEHAAQVAADALDQYGDGSTDRTLGAALHGSMNTARAATLHDGPVGAVYASEILDGNTCKPCRDVDGRWLCNTDDLAPLELTYPAGAYGGYLYCLGRDRCRGTVVGVWRKGRAGS